LSALHVCGAQYLLKKIKGILVYKLRLQRPITRFMTK
jgi:hypothetical protein